MRSQDGEGHAARDIGRGVKKNSAMKNIMIVLGAIAAGVILLWFLWRRYIVHLASKTAQNIFPVWAGQGPFENGTESARAFKAAYTTVLGPEKAAEFQEAIEKHRIAYDRDPEAWENIRNQSLRKSKEIDDYVTMAKGLASLDSINEELFADIGYRLEAVTNDSGRIDLARKQIWSDEEIKKRREEDNKTIINALGEGLLNSERDAAKKLLNFIVSIYRSAHERDPETAYEIGSTLLKGMTYSDENPDEEISKDFRRLYDEYSTDNDEEQNT